MTESTYIHGTAPEEQRRLSLLNDVLLNPALLHEIGLQGSERIIDFGSGLGQFTRAMARAASHGKAVGIERNEEQLALARRLAAEDGEAELVEFRQGDVLGAELEWGTYDLAHTRFVLEHVPDPLRVVKTMVRAVRPGGRVILADDDHDVLRTGGVGGGAARPRLSRTLGAVTGGLTPASATIRSSDAGSCSCSTKRARS